MQEKKFIRKIEGILLGKIFKTLSWKIMFLTLITSVREIVDLQLCNWVSFNRMITVLLTSIEWFISNAISRANAPDAPNPIKIKVSFRDEDKKPSWHYHFSVFKYDTKLSFFCKSKLCVPLYYHIVLCFEIQLPS